MCSPHAIEIDRLWARGQGLLHPELSFRDCIAAADGFCLLSVDYAQLEMRILAHFSRDSALTAIFSDSKQDLFKSVAAELSGTDPSKVDSVDRNIAKRLCYAIVYGMTSHTLAAELEVEEHEAASYIRTFMTKFPGVADFIERAHDEGATRGFVTTLLGSRRYLSESESSSKAQVQKLYRKAVNSICQGSAADVIRTAMVRIFETMESSIHTHCEQWKESALDRTRRPPLPPVRLVLQIHDELLFEVQQDKLPLLKHVVVESMQLATPLSVPLQVKIKVGTRWGSLRETPYP
jgi:DNA polymerase theta